MVATFVTWHQQKVKSFFVSYKNQGVTKEIHGLLFLVISFIFIHLKQLVKKSPYAVRTKERPFILNSGPYNDGLKKPFRRLGSMYAFAFTSI